jgi:hypothetical protein
MEVVAGSWYDDGGGIVVVENNIFKNLAFFDPIALYLVSSPASRYIIIHDHPS